MALAEFAEIHEERLAILNEVRHELQGEPTTIALLKRNQNNGGLQEFMSVPVSKERVRLALGGFQEVFQVAETWITDADAEAVGMVRHGDKNYKVKLAAKPSGFDRYYVLEIQPV